MDISDMPTMSLPDMDLPPTDGLGGKDSKDCKQEESQDRKDLGC